MKHIEFSLEEKLIVSLPETDERVLVYGDKNAIRVVNDRCKHRGGPLHQCVVYERGIKRCPWHGRAVSGEETSNIVCAVFHRTSRRLTLVNPRRGLWPVKRVGDLPITTIHKIGKT